MKFTATFRDGIIHTFEADDYDYNDDVMEFVNVDDNGDDHIVTIISICNLNYIDITEE